MPAVQQYRSGTPALVLDEIAGAAEDSIATASPFLVRADSGPKPGRKKLVRRDDREYSQALRQGVQLFLVALNLWIGIQFYLWVRWPRVRSHQGEAAQSRPDRFRSLGATGIADLQSLDHVIDET